MLNTPIEQKVPLTVQDIPRCATDVRKAVVFAVNILIRLYITFQYYNCQFFHYDDIIKIISFSEKGISAYKTLSSSKGCLHAQGGIPFSCYRKTSNCDVACSAYDKCVGYSEGMSSSKRYQCYLWVTSSSCPSYFKRSPRGKTARSKSDLLGTGVRNYNCMAQNGKLAVKIQ